MFYLFDRKYYMDLFVSQWHFWHFSFLSNYWTSVIWPDIWHTEINFLHWKVVCSHSFLICLDSVRIKYGFLSDSLFPSLCSCLLTLWHVIDRHEAWGFGQVDQMDPVIFDIMQFSKPIFDCYNQNCIKIHCCLLCRCCWSQGSHCF